MGDNNENEKNITSIDSLEENAFINFLKIIHETDISDFVVIGDVAVNIYDKKNKRPTNEFDVMISIEDDQKIEEKLVEMRYLVKHTQKKHFKYYTKGENNVIYTRPYEKDLITKFFKDTYEITFPIKIENEVEQVKLFIPAIPQLIKTKIDAVEDMNRGDKDVIDINRLFKVGLQDKNSLNKLDLVDIIKYFKMKEKQIKIHNNRGWKLLIKTFKKISKL